MKKMKLVALVLPLALALSACGSKSIGTPAQRGLTPKDTGQRQSCPTPPNPTHLITVTFPQAVPARLAVRFPTDTNNFHMSECSSIPVTGLIVTLGRPSANVLAISIDNNHAYTDANGVSTLPSSQAIEVLDLHSCDTSTPTTIYKPANPVPILWKVDYAAGASCPPKVSGTGNGAPSVEDVADGDQSPL